MLALNPSASVEVAVGASSVTFGALIPNSGVIGGARAVYCGNVAAWVAQGIPATTWTNSYPTSTTVFSTASAHNLRPGMPVQVSNSGGALPTGVSAATQYFAIVLSAKTFSLATSHANAIAGTALSLTGAGTGTQSMQTIAVAASGAMYMPAGVLALLDGWWGSQVSVIEDSTGGKASLTPVSG